MSSLKDLHDTRCSTRGNENYFKTADIEIYPNHIEIYEKCTVNKIDLGIILRAKGKKR